jgi:hypothetical protein
MWCRCAGRCVPVFKVGLSQIATLCCATSRGTRRMSLLLRRAWRDGESRTLLRVGVRVMALRPGYWTEERQRYRARASAFENICYIHSYRHFQLSNLRTWMEADLMDCASNDQMFVQLKYAALRNACHIPAHTTLDVTGTTCPISQLPSQNLHCPNSFSNTMHQIL